MSDLQNTTALSGNETETDVLSEANDPASFLNKLAQASSPIVMNQDMHFTFKKPRKGADGKPATDELGQEIQARPPLKLIVPVPTWDGIIDALQDEKQKDFILDVIGDVVREAVRQQVSDETNPVMSQDQIKFEMLTLQYLANLPKSERTGRGIPKETWAEWVEDYIATIIETTGGSAEKVGNQAKIFYPGRLQTVKTTKNVLTFLRNQLDKWAATSQNAETYSDIYEFLKKKADEFLSADESSLLANLQD